ncbi:hypothetical protein XBI1_2810016 [Xenorhabdus bovienii str. Intermedium]|uniref:Uncharacterized protein n=1 Tax=Xenorhabdus bovienii str. Intermedium TaxID=1379677 RepID=A0A077QCP7_XENBV|nr:hypothetical protein XBI1_2810016 [Xenorhabdus bovienii str. Intermedium]
MQSELIAFFDLVNIFQMIMKNISFENKI